MEVFMKSVLFSIILSLSAIIGSSLAHAHCGDADMHADKPKEEEKEKES
tara:strand:+ start:15319 stop:15465 length:147 start_codon:yes stop_codon:yes gene_type:complete